VNTTSLGMGGDAVPDIDFTVDADPHALVTDIVYVPLDHADPSDGKRAQDLIELSTDWECCFTRLPRDLKPGSAH
jgi:hypothetical protein